MAGERKPVSVSTLTKGSYCVIDDVACRVTDIKVSRPGKHGHAKANITAVGLLDDKKRNIVLPGHDNIDAPVIDKRTAQVLSVSGTKANIMDMETYETFDMEIPPELQWQVTDCVQILYWTILTERVMKQIKG